MSRVLDWRVNVLGRILLSLDPETDEWMRVAESRAALLRQQVGGRFDYDPTSVMSLVL